MYIISSNTHWQRVFLLLLYKLQGHTSVGCMSLFKPAGGSVSAGFLYAFLGCGVLSSNRIAVVFIGGGTVNRWSKEFLSLDDHEILIVGRKNLWL